MALSGDPRIAPIQFALAGMNAHINHDLPLALVSICQARSVELGRDSPQRRDYLKINDTIAASGAQEVWLTHGSTGPMTRWLVDRGVNARQIATQYQGELDEEPITAED